MNQQPLLKVKDLKKHFPIRSGLLLRQTGAVKAVDEVSFEVYPGETIGIVGESGCGKSTLGRTLIRLYDPTAGNIYFNGKDIAKLKGKELKETRKDIQMIFQDPFASFNPTHTIGQILAEPFRSYGIGTAEERREWSRELLKKVSLNPNVLNRYPHEFSGGQRQRIGIARALALNPDLLICDEPVSALDVSVQAQVLNLLRDLKDDLSLTYLFVSHNLAVVDYMADRIAVMCAGHLVELAPREALFRNPVHPYTRALLAAVPRANPAERLDLDALMGGRVSVPSQWPAPFTVTAERVPALLEIEPGHQVRADEGLLGRPAA